MSSCEDVEKLLERVRREVSSLSDEIKDLRERRIRSLEESFVRRVEELSKDLDRMYFEYKNSIEASTQSYLNQLSHFSKLLDEWDAKVRSRIDSLDKKIERIGVEGVVRSFSEKSDELLSKINLSLEKYLEGLKNRVDEAERSLKELQEKIESLRKLEKNVEEDVLKRFGKKADSLRTAMNDFFGSLRENLNIFHRDVMKKTDDLVEKIGYLKRDLRDMMENFVKEINNITNSFSKTVDEETNKIVRNVERAADISSEMMRLRRGQRRLLTLIIIQMILQIVMIYLFFFR
jgi:septal ring factor EnvC (AmiA/AmiB activator)